MYCVNNFNDMLTGITKRKNFSVEDVGLKFTSEKEEEYVR